MAPSKLNEPPPSFTATGTSSEPYTGAPRNVEYINNINFASSLQPRSYEIRGTHPDSKILFTDVTILDSTGQEPYRGDVLIMGERIAEVGVVLNVDELKQDPNVRLSSSC
ncbi:hypothetical protein BP5796_12791 [Coleophoma crateriformis]|uniref:Uncharacterized protein n=1 Tax=Coleophoma crateriformis TaxID=565419 RepID=A0A3D8Q6A9_9HELO|nr:hypothetical protein BP5796_12791 [Coleophoma crateriformis]